MSELKRTPLHDLHMELGAKMVPFAGYDMPVQYPMGVMQEHIHTRTKAGLFDVSHMGQVVIWPKSGNYEDAALALEKLVPADVVGLGQMRQRYGLLLNDQGGILDDLMFANFGDHIYVVVNAACKDADIALLKAQLSETCTVEVLEDRALLALQGPAAGAVMAQLNAATKNMRFMDVARDIDLNGISAVMSRSGYTGEDGFEISVAAKDAVALAQMLLAHEDVAPIGLGARDSLRLEAGLCLYGQDMDEGVTPVEASLSWAIQKVRRAGGERAGGFTGADVVLAALETGVERRRVGLKPEGRAPMRQGVPLFQTAEGGEQIGVITSGGFGPTFGGPVAMGFVADGLHTDGTQLYGELRGKRMPVTVAKLPFIAANFKR